MKWTELLLEDIEELEIRELTDQALNDRLPVEVKKHPGDFAVFVLNLPGLPEVKVIRPQMDGSYVFFWDQGRWRKSEAEDPDLDDVDTVLWFLVVSSVDPYISYADWAGSDDRVNLHRLHSDKSKLLQKPPKVVERERQVRRQKTLFDKLSGNSANVAAYIKKQGWKVPH